MAPVTTTVGGRRWNEATLVSIVGMVCLLLLAVFILYPVAMTFGLSLTAPDGSWSIAPYSKIMSTARLRMAVWHSLLLGCITATFSVVVGYIFAFLLGRTGVRWKKFFRMMSTLPIISPPFMLTLSLILLLGKNGILTRFLGLENFTIYGMWGLVLVQTLSMFPIAFLTLDGVLQGIDNTTEDAALNLGAGRLRTFLDVTLPLSMPGVLSAWLLVFVTSLADFANPMVLAGNFDVLSSEAYLQFTGMGNAPLGAALSNMLLIPCVMAYAFQKYHLSKKSFVTVSGKPQRLHRDLTTRITREILFAVALVVSLITLVLYGTVIAGCFTKTWGIDYSFSLDNFAYVLSVGGKAIADTFILSAIATPIAGFLGLVIAYLVVRKSFFGRKVLDILALVPFALPGTAVGIGYILAFNREPLVLTGTATIIILCFVFRNMPVGIESAKVSLIQIDRAIEEAATNLGASTWRVFREITLPLIKPAIFAGMAYVFVHCMTAVSAVIFLVSARWNHMTVLILSQTEIFRFSAAAVLCLILIVIVMVSFWFLRKVIGVNASNIGAQGA